MTMAAGGPSFEQKPNASLQLLYRYAFVIRDVFQLDGLHGFSGLLFFWGKY